MTPKKTKQKLEKTQEKTLGNNWVQNVGIPIAAGLIVGEALVGVGDAMRVVIFET